jgi:hypothetical protein
VRTPSRISGGGGPCGDALHGECRLWSRSGPVSTGPVSTGPVSTGPVSHADQAQLNKLTEPQGDPARLL